MQTHPRPGVVPWLVGAGLAVSVASVWVFGFRAPGLLLGGLLGACAVARLLLPPRLAGTLAVRSKAIDVATLSTLGAAVVLLALTAPAT